VGHPRADARSHHPDPRAYQADRGLSHDVCGASQAEIGEILRDYQDHGIVNIMALRGDPPKGETAFGSRRGFAYAADLVRFIRSHFPGWVSCSRLPEGHPETRTGSWSWTLKAKWTPARLHLYQSFSTIATSTISASGATSRGSRSGHRRHHAGDSLKGMRRMAELALGARFPAG